MHLVIINASPRVKQKSNTDKIVSKFVEGYSEKGNTTEYYCLSDRKQWEDAKKAFENNDNILFAIPLYVENIPGIMLEFVEMLDSKEHDNKKVSYILQGGFAEAAQLRCGERYLEILTDHLGCIYGGTLIKGDNFGIALVPEKIANSMTNPYIEMGKVFAREGVFKKEVVNRFAGPESFGLGIRIYISTIGRVFQRMMFRSVAKSWGCTEKLDKKVY